MSALRLKIPWMGFGNKKARGVNLRLEFFDTASAYNIGTISDLHEIYAFQFGFARLELKFVAFCCERDRVTEISE